MSYEFFLLLLPKKPSLGYLTSFMILATQVIRVLLDQNLNGNFLIKNIELNMIYKFVDDNILI